MDKVILQAHWKIVNVHGCGSYILNMLFYRWKAGTDSRPELVKVLVLVWSFSQSRILCLPLPCTPFVIVQLAGLKNNPPGRKQWDVAGLGKLGRVRGTENTLLYWFQISSALMLWFASGELNKLFLALFQIWNSTTKHWKLFTNSLNTSHSAPGGTIDSS